MTETRQTKRDAARAKAEAQRAAAKKKQAQRRLALAVGSIVLVLALIVGFVAVRLASKDKAPAQGSASRPVPAAALAQVTSVPAAVLDQIGRGDATALPKPITAPALTKDGKPRIVYIGADYCPYCAAERWAMVVALSRFGKFAKLRTSHSATDDAFPGTPTFSFHGASYDGSYVSLEAVETQTNERTAAGTYGPLDKLTAEQEALVGKYDAPPYVAASSAGAIPFVDFGGRFLTVGSTFSPQALAGKTFEQVAAGIQSPQTDVARSVGGAANAITAVICTLTSGQPGPVCGSATIKSLQGQLRAAG